MYLVFFCFKKPVKSENKIEILLPLVHWCESIHNKLQSLTTFSSDTNSQLRSLLLVSIAECLPRSNHESTYLVGSKRRSGGPTNLINKSEDTVVVINEALVGVMIRFNVIIYIKALKSNNFYFSKLGKGAGTPYRCVPSQKSTDQH